MPRSPHAVVHPFKGVLIDFLNDLKMLQADGLEEEQCRRVRGCLQAIVHHLSTQQNPSEWLAELKARFDELLADYVIWNNPSGIMSPPEHRAKQEGQLRKDRNSILPEFSYGPLFATEEELRIFDRCYEEFLALATLPDPPPPTGPYFKKTVQRATEKRKKLMAK